MTTLRDPLAPPEVSIGSSVAVGASAGAATLRAERIHAEGVRCDASHGLIVGREVVVTEAGSVYRGKSGHITELLAGGSVRVLLDRELDAITFAPGALYAVNEPEPWTAGG